MERSAYRVVLNYASNETLITGIKHRFNAKLNLDAGKLMLLLAKKQLTISELKIKYANFYEQCKSFNWFTHGVVNYNISTINSLYHLKRIQIELSRFCNLNCSYCYSSCGPAQKSKLTVDKVKEFIDDAYNLGCLWVDFTGGEPLAYKEWETVIAYAINKGLSTSLHTNGTLLSAKNVQKLKAMGICYIQVSLDSHIAKVHDQARQRPGAFNKTMLGIELCKKNSIPIIINIVAHKGNKNHYIESVNYFSKTLDLKVLMDRVVKSGREISNNFGISTKEYFKMIRPLIKKGVAEAKVCDNNADSLKIEPSCGVAHSFIYITAEGEFALCPTMTSRENSLLFSSPTMELFTLETAWNSSAYILKYRGLNCKNITKCPANINCGGGCRSNAYIETGELDSPDLLSCNIFKNTTKYFSCFKDSSNIIPKAQEIPVAICK